MKVNVKLLGFLTLLLILSQTVSSTYLEILKELDERIICLLIFFAAPITTLLLALGGLRLMTTDNPTARDAAKRLIYNAIAGLVILIGFIFFAVFIGNLDISQC